MASLVRSPSRTRLFSFSSTWSISLFRAMICFWMFSTFASLFEASSSTSWRSLSAALICSSNSATRLSTFSFSRASASVSFWTFPFSLFASAISVRSCLRVSFDVSIPSVARPRHGPVQATAELFLLGFEPPLVRFMFRDLFPRPHDLALDELAVLVGHLGLRGREALVQVSVLQGPVPVGFELFDLFVDLVEDDPDSLEVLFRLLSLPLGLPYRHVELRDPRDVVADPASL